MLLFVRIRNGEKLAETRDTYLKLFLPSFKEIFCSRGKNCKCANDITYIGIEDNQRYLRITKDNQGEPALTSGNVLRANSFYAMRKL